MTREQFLALPQVLQIRLLFDSLDDESTRALLDQEAPKVPLPPKYDLAIYRSGGNMWASETALDGLEYWAKKYKAGAEGGGQYATQDAKRLANMEKWIAWRQLFPSECWSGKRGDEDVVARPPSTRPTVYPRQGGGQRRTAPQEQQQDVDPENFTF
jgi:hypothetical protein